jgi:L-fucose mutarotase
MLKRVPPLITPELLHALASMGHGDDLALVDAHFPASRVAHQGQNRLIRLPGLSVTQVLDAVLQLLPIDEAGSGCAWTMQVMNNPNEVPQAVNAINGVLASSGHAQAATLERFAFYEQAMKAFVVVQTGDTRTYANVMLRKGLVHHD